MEAANSPGEPLSSSVLVPLFSGATDMNKRLLALSALIAALPAAVYAEDPPKSDWSVSSNVGVFSEYRFRGISQTNKKPAIQGGFDVAHSSGFYLGNWDSNVDSELYTGSNIEMDFYGGYKVPIGGFALDLGGIYYYYPGSGNTTSYPGSFKIDNFELYAGGSYGPFSLKYSQALTDFFGAPDSKNSYYLDAGFAYDLGQGLGINAHLGYQKLKGGAKVAQINNPALIDNITDWKIGVTYDYKGYVFGLSYIDTNRDLTGGTAAATNRNISSGTGVVSLSRSF
jgi:uncharacterized protein (TIGR02001 family)